METNETSSDRVFVMVSTPYTREGRPSGHEPRGKSPNPVEWSPNPVPWTSTPRTGCHSWGTIVLLHGNKQNYQVQSHRSKKKM